MPETWKSARLGDVAEIALSSVDKHVVQSEVDVSLCNYIDVYRHRRLRNAMKFSRGSVTPTELARFMLQKGDIIITKDSETPDDIGVPSLVVEDLDHVVCGYHLALIRIADNILSPGFLLHYLQSDAAKRHFLRTANGLTRFGLGARAISSLPLPLPRTDEQIRIAQILDAVDTALERTRETIQRVESLNSVVLENIFASLEAPKFSNQVQRRYDPELLWECNMISSCWTIELRFTGFMKPVNLVAKLLA